MKTLVIILISGFILFEVIEHIVIPLFSRKHQKRKPISGVSSMLGQVVVIKQWEETEGQVLFRSELWRATSDLPLKKGDKAVIQDVQGLTVRVKPFVNDILPEN